jgi:hypothetical protein
MLQGQEQCVSVSVVAGGDAAMHERLTVVEVVTAVVLVPSPRVCWYIA